MPPRKLYPVIRDARWITPRRRNFRWQCCGCLMVHVLNFRIRREPRGQTIQFQVFLPQEVDRRGRVRR